MKKSAFEKLEAEYLELVYQRNLLQWDNYAEGQKHDLNVVDHAIYNLVTSAESIPTENRRCRVLNDVFSRERVDTHPDISCLRNRLDDWSCYDDAAAASHGTSLADRDGRKASRMKPDVLKLMRLRNELARKSGYASYPHLVLETEELDYHWLIRMLETFVYRQLPAARALVESHRISWDTWFRDIDQIGSAAGEWDPERLISQVSHMLDFDPLLARISRHRFDKGLAGYATVISAPDDIRMLYRWNGTLHAVMTLFHELGHAVAQAGNAQTGILQTCTAVHDETMAQVMQHIAMKLTLSPDERMSARAINCLESVRCALSALFEFALWNDPDDADQLYSRFYVRLGYTISASDLWALDSFRSLDPVYVHNYVIAESVGNRTLLFLERTHGDDYRKWGRWLLDHHYKDARSRSFQEKAGLVGWE